MSHDRVESKGLNTHGAIVPEYLFALPAANALIAMGLRYPLALVVQAASLLFLMGVVALYCMYLPRARYARVSHLSKQSLGRRVFALGKFEGWMCDKILVDGVVARPAPSVRVIATDMHEHRDHGWVLVELEANDDSVEGYDRFGRKAGAPRLQCSQIERVSWIDAYFGTAARARTWFLAWGALAFTTVTIVVRLALL